MNIHKIRWDKVNAYIEVRQEIGLSDSWSVHKEAIEACCSRHCSVNWPVVWREFQQWYDKAKAFPSWRAQMKKIDILINRL